MFDSVAPQFDRKLAALGYQAPQQVAQAVAALQPAPGALDVADLGCGTGLCGPTLRPWARRLVGCDLSAAMLAQAKRRGCYDHLFQVELAYFLQHEAGAFDLLVSADTLCCFGPLDAVCAAAVALRSGGAFVFTVEALLDHGAPFLPADQRPLCPQRRLSVGHLARGGPGHRSVQRGHAAARGRLAGGRLAADGAAGLSGCKAHRFATQVCR